MRTVYVVISCDVDPDRERLLEGTSSGRLAWRGVTEGIPAIKQAVRGVTDTSSREPVFTWLLRADEQVRELEGTYDALVRSQRSLLESLQASGDELGWHPHFWRRDSPSSRWFQEVEDLDWQVDMLRRSHGALAPVFPGTVESVRMGWSYHNNRTFAALEDLGITVDLSGIPGLRTFGREPPRRGENLFDWHATPRVPYWPSRVDYRRPPHHGEDASNVLEVPSFVSTAPLWSVLGGLHLARKTRSPAQVWYAVRRPAYCVTLTSKPIVFDPLVSQLRRLLRRGGDGPLVFETHFHADELVPNRSSLYDLASVRPNLEAVLRVCRQTETPLYFVAARAIRALWLD